MDNIHQRDRVGVDDFVLLDDHQNVDSFLANLRKRFHENIIYTYIGQVLISVNPYKNLPLYDGKIVQNYRNVNFYELSPHLFAIADSSFRVMVEESRDQCILISGESGSGKTEASKKILKYFSEITSNERIEHINDMLLSSNPLLEAFGNAQTSHNHNSSRFGKYMDIEFNYLGNPIGGHINIYLLEKSRVVFQNKNEQNFHIFYLLLNGLDDHLLQRLQLKRDPRDYFYLNQNDCFDVIGNFQNVQNALNMFAFTDEETFSIFSILASILHLGNVGFFEEDDGRTIISNLKPVSIICKLLDCNETILKNALVSQTIEARSESIVSGLTRDLAIYARDALAKAIYERLFEWLVKRLNHSLQNQSKELRRTLMGLLDIYGFEIFEKNTFEQFCINYCNEKLQQLFIELTLKQEQEEYCREKIEWEPVQYFNNEIICSLIEKRHLGIISLLDEECLRPGDTNDLTLLEKLNSNLQQHPHYFPVNNLRVKSRQNGMVSNQFRIVHYAGNVDYDIDGFIDKNNDLLYRDLKKAMCSSKNVILAQLFNADELTNLKRPITAATQFRISLNNLMNLLSHKEPWYIRCIKPNDIQKANVFDDELVKHQIKYLGLMENLRVRRAGFAYRRNYNDFLERYKCLCPKTWPYYKGSFRDGVQVLINHFGYGPNDYAMGVTKIFIRSPQTLFQIEDEFQQKKHSLATQIQACFKGYRQRKSYQNFRKSTITAQSYIRQYLAKKEFEKRRNAAFVIRNFIKGFKTRNMEPNEFNRMFLRQVKIHWLKTLSTKLPKSVLSKEWPIPPKCCLEASEYLRVLHKKWLARNYVLNISEKRKEILKEKVLAEKLFKNKKCSYLASVPEPFQYNRLNAQADEMRKNVFEVQYKGENEKTKYCCSVNKFDRHGYTLRSRILIITNKKLYLLCDNKKKLSIKEILPLNLINKIVISGLNDGLFVVKYPIQKKEKGDIILEQPNNLIELLTKLIEIIGEDKLTITDDKCVEHVMAGGKRGQIYFTDGTRNEISKRKEGGLEVSSIC